MEGRFISKDPAGFKGGINLYSYTSNNPITHSDASGLCPCAGGEWDEKFGFSDWQFTVAWGGYISTGRVNFKCLSDPCLKCSAKQFCIGGGLIGGIGFSFNLYGKVYGAYDSSNLSGWSWQIAGGGGPVGGQNPFNGGGSLGLGASLGGGLALINCNIYDLKCTK